MSIIHTITSVKTIFPVLKRRATRSSLHKHFNVPHQPGCWCGINALPWRGLNQCAPVCIPWMLLSPHYHHHQQQHPHPHSNSIHTTVHRRWLEPVEAKRVLCGGISKDHVWVIEHVQAIKRQRVDFQIVQREVGVNIEADICGQRASKVLGQAGRRLSTHWGEKQ